MLRLATVHPTTALKRTVKSKKPAAATTTAANELRGGALPAKDAKEDGGGDLRSAVEVPESSGMSHVQEEELDDDDDSDYDYEAECEDAEEDELASDGEDSEEEDKEEHRRALEAELDECADEGPDFYLKHMQAEREQLDGEDAAWVDRYIALQREWKERHAYSIDAFDLDAKLPVHTPKPKKKKRLTTLKKRAKLVRRGQPGAKRKVRRPYATQLRVFWRFWYTRVAPLLPVQLQHEPAEYVLTLFVVIAFVVLALAIQVYVALRAAPSLATD